MLFAYIFALFCDKIDFLVINRVVYSSVFLCVDILVYNVVLDNICDIYYLSSNVNYFKLIYYSAFFLLFFIQMHHFRIVYYVVFSTTQISAFYVRQKNKKR